MVLFLFEDLLSNEYKSGSFVVVNKKMKKNEQEITWLYSISIG